MIAGSRLLVVVAHPDDETLGFAAALMAAREAAVLILADGETSRGSAARGAIDARDEAAVAALNVLCANGARDLRVCRFPDQRLDERALLDLTREIERDLKVFRPDVVCTHHAGDLNLDHALVARATLTACRPLAGSSVRAVYAGEVPSATEWGFGVGAGAFEPSTFLAVDVERKLAAMRCYAAEMRPHPHPRSEEAIRALATWRGAQAGLPAAEAYRQVWAR